MNEIPIDVVGVVKNDNNPDLQILVERECYFIYQWYGDDGPYDDWAANQDHLQHYFEEAGWEIAWRPELQMPTEWNWGPGARRESNPEPVTRGLEPE